MAQKQDTTFAQVLSATMPPPAPPAAPAPPQNAAPAAPSIQEQLQAMLLRRMQQEDAEKQGVIDAAERMRQSQIPAFHRAELEREQAQAMCAHTKEGTNRTALGGQRDHKHVAHYLCQNCHKEWHSNNADHMHELQIRGLMPDPTTIGGPLG